MADKFVGDEEEAKAILQLLKKDGENPPANSPPKEPKVPSVPKSPFTPKKP